VIAIVVWQSGLGQKPAGLCEAGDAPARNFVPSDVERCQFRKELQFAVREMIMDLLRHRLPRHTFFQTIDEPWDDDRRHRSHSSIFASLVPDVASAIGCVRGAIVEMCVAEGVDFRRAVGRPDRQSAECRLQGLEQIFTKASTGGDGEIRIARQIGHMVDVCDVAAEEIAHEERLR